MRDRSSRAIVFGVALVVAGVALGWSGLAPLSETWEAQGGYFMSDPLTVDRATHAVVAEDVDLLRGRYDTLAEETFLFSFMGEPDEVRMQGIPSTSDGLFMGIAPTTTVETYLGDVAHDEIVDWDANQASITDVEYTSHEGVTIPGDPGSESFWVASASGTGGQTLEWTIEPGDWTVVVMNEDASRGVVAELRFGTLVPAGLETIAWTLFALGLVVLICGAWFLDLGLRRWSNDSEPEVGAGSPVVAPETDTPKEPVGSAS